MEMEMEAPAKAALGDAASCEGLHRESDEIFTMEEEEEEEEWGILLGAAVVVMEAKKGQGFFSDNILC
jgi:hypothetical protein